MLNITIAKKNEEAELKAKTQLEKIVQKYDLTKYFFTKDITFESQTIPTSHPVLTLNTRYMNDDNSALAAFIHEELHWYLDQSPNQTDKVIEELKRRYPNVPIGRHEGARSEYSTYLHLILNTLEFEGMKNFVGVEEATRVVKSKDYYIWIYQKVLEDNSVLKKILAKNDLLL